MKSLLQICKRNDPGVCQGFKLATEPIIWKPTGERFLVCEDCRDAILKRSKRSSQQWKEG